MHEEHNHEQPMVAGESNPREYAKFAVVIIAILALSLIFNGGGFEEWMRYFMGFFFLTFGVFKFIGYEMFAVMFAGYDLIAQRWRPYAYLYPFIELALAVFYLSDQMPMLRDLATLAIMSVGAAGVWQEIQKRSGVHCACLGNVIKLPLSTVSLVEDVTMGIMAALMLIL